MSCSNGAHRHAHVVVVFLYRHTEADWSDFDKAEGTKAYIKSKTLAERAAWQFVREGWKTEGLPRPSFELVVRARSSIRCHSATVSPSGCAMAMLLRYHPGADTESLLHPGPHAYEPCWHVHEASAPPDERQYAWVP